MNTQNLKPGKNKVSYSSCGQKISAFVFIPKDFKDGEKRPAIIVTRPGSGVKEQTAGTYAEKFSEQGFISIAFDPRGFGESEGYPLFENPYYISEDTKNSVSFLSSLEQVDTEQIFNIGICMGGGYAAWATAHDARVKGYAMITPDLQNHDLLREAVGGADNIRSLYITPISKARQIYHETGENILFKMVPETQEEIDAPGMTLGQIQARDYYITGPGSKEFCPNWQNGFAMESVESLLAFYAFDALDILKDVPYFLACGTEAYAYKHAKMFYNKVDAPKEELIFEGANHFDMYYKLQYIDPIVDAVSVFFKKQL